MGGCDGIWWEEARNAAQNYTKELSCPKCLWCQAGHPSAQPLIAYQGHGKEGWEHTFKRFFLKELTEISLPITSDRKEEKGLGFREEATQSCWLQVRREGWYLHDGGELMEECCPRQKWQQRPGFGFSFQACVILVRFCYISKPREFYFFSNYGFMNTYYVMVITV